MAITFAVTPCIDVIIHSEPRGISESSSDSAVQTIPFTLISPFSSFEIGFITIAEAPVRESTFVFVCPLFNFFTAKGRVQINKIMEITAHIKSCHGKGNFEKEIKIITNDPIANHIVTNAFVAASITRKITKAASQNHGRLFNISSYINQLYWKGYNMQVAGFVLYFKV